MSTGTLLFLVQIQGLLGSKLRKNVIFLNFACKHNKSIMPGPIKFKLGVCVSHDEYMNPIVFGAIQCLLGSKLSKKGDFVIFVKLCS